MLRKLAQTITVTLPQVFGQPFLQTQRLYRQCACVHRPTFLPPSAEAVQHAVGPPPKCGRHAGHEGPPRARRKIPSVKIAHRVRTIAPIGEPCFETEFRQDTTHTSQRTRRTRAPWKPARHLNHNTRARSPFPRSTNSPKCDTLWPTNYRTSSVLVPTPRRV